MVEKTRASIVAELRQAFEAVHLETPALDARLLVRGILGLRQEDLLLHPDKPVSAAECQKLEEAKQRRIRREPVSRILGSRSFWQSEFIVSPDTLDPRADSETLIEAVLRDADKQAPLRILDLGTGTGCLLLSLLQELPQASGVGVDISAGAVAIAETNARNLGLEGRSLFITSSWIDMPLNESFDIVVSNPPYIAAAEIANLAPEVKEYDPLRALVGGSDGLQCYREITGLLPQLLKEGGKVFFEIGYDQLDFVKGILAEGGLHVLQSYLDIAGHDRCIVAQWKGLPQ